MNRILSIAWRYGLGVACCAAAVGCDVSAPEDPVDFERSEPDRDRFVHQRGTELVGPDGERIDIRGINVGGGFLWEGWMFGGGVLHSETDLYGRLARPGALGEDGAARFRTQLDRAWVARPDLRRIAALGFNTVRIPLNHTVFDDAARIAQLDRLIDACESEGLYVILDLHAAPRSQNTVGLISDWNWGERTMWDWETWDQTKRETAALWRRIARRYRTRTHILGYDLLNEPDTTLLGLSPLNRHLLPEMYAAIIAAIRAVDTDHLVIVEGDEFATEFDALTAPVDDNMAYEFHMYSWTVDAQDYDAAVADWVAISRAQRVPMFAGEFGVDAASEIRAQREAFDRAGDALSGWMLWSWKSADVQQGQWQGRPSATIEHGVREFAVEQPWRSTVLWASGELDASKPPAAEIRAGAAEFLEQVRFANTTENRAVLEALFPE